MFCILPNLRGFKRLGQPKVAVEYDPMDLIGFIERNFRSLNAMMERTEMSEMNTRDASRRVTGTATSQSRRAVERRASSPTRVAMPREE